MGRKKIKKPMKLKLIPILIVVAIIVIVISAVILVTVLKQNYIVYENIKASKEVSVKEVKESKILILNNVILGGVNNSKWIDSKTFYDNMRDTEFDIDMYSDSLKYGTYKTAELKYNANTDIVYTLTTKLPTPDKYFAITKDESIERNPYLEEKKVDKEDEKYVKSALGKYRFLNNSVKISHVYNTNVEKGTQGKIIVATSSTNTFGVYSTVIYVGSKGPEIIKYSYVKNSERSTSWPVYDLQLVIDIEGDGTSEVILQETTETTSSYVVMKYMDGKFYEVLKETMNV